MVDAITSSSSLASAYAAQAAQSSLRAEAQTQNAGAATQAAQRTSGAQTNSAQAVQPAAQNDSRSNTGTRSYASGTETPIRPDASTGRGQRVDIYA